MKKLFTAICLFLTVLVLAPQKSNATHMAGAEIAYIYQGTPNSYLFRIKFYRDCAGIFPTVPMPLCISSASLGFSTTIYLNVVTQTVIPNPPCVTLPSPNCSQGFGGIGTEEYVCEALYTLPAQATDWVFSWSDCCRNTAITTLQPNGMYVAATLDNVTPPTGVTDNSPIFNFIPYTTFCVGYPFYYDQGATDPDGDSLVFLLANAQESNGCPPVPTNLQYLTNPQTGLLYSGAQPVASSVPITIDSKTGVIYFIPSIQQVAVICVLVQEYDTTGPGPAVFKGTVKRDIQVVITNQCNIVNPAFDLNATYVPIGDTTGATAGPYFCGDNQFVLPFAERVQCGSIVPSDIRVMRSLGFPNPVVSAVPLACPNGRADSIVVTCLYPLTAGHNLVVIKTGSDGNSLLSQCGSAMQPFKDTADIIINDFSVWQPAVDSLSCVFISKTVTFNENIFCYTIANDGSDLLLRDASGTSTLPISNAFGYCGPNGEQSTQMLMTFANMQSPTGSVYYLTVKMGNDGNTIANECGRFLDVGDTLAVFYIDNDIEVDLGSDLSVCDNATTAPVLTSGFIDPTLTYQWSFNSNPISGATNPTYTPSLPLVSGSYTLNLFVTANSVCRGADTTLLTVNLTPTVSVNDYIGCIGDVVTLDAGSAGLGYSYQWYLNGNGIAGATQQTYSPTQNGTYTAFVSNGNCFASDDALVTLYPAPAVPQFHNQDQSVCTGSAVTLDAENAGSVYQWFVNGTAVSNAQTFTPSTSTSGAYNISVVVGITGLNCNTTGSMVLTVVDYPVLAVSDNHSCVGSTYPTFDAGSAAGVTYQWTDQGSTVVSNTNTFTPPSNLAVGTYNYTVSATAVPGCTSTDAIVFTVDALPDVNAGSDVPFCETAPGTLTATSTATNITSYQWSNGQNGQSISGINTPGDYTVTATDANNCVNSDTVTVSIDRVLSAPVVTCGTGTGSINYKFVYTWSDISGGSSAVTYEVSEDNGSNWVAANQPSGATSHGTNSIVPYFLVRGVNTNLVIPCDRGRNSEPVACSVIIPNIITPNKDNVNDEFTVANIEQYPNNHMTILNRWGKEVYSNTYDNSGNVFKGTDLPDGVYFYMLELGDGKTEPLTGTVTISGSKK